ncbi:MAG: metal ABC transporter substrate-binding protein [Candidatus Nanopelagicales bacterium]|nr:metal ABC transporter substrate-binding protein [Candidatus Nanopelagicales bacterium]
MRNRVLLGASALLLGLPLVAACSSSDTSASSTTGKVNVVAAFYPLQYAASQVGGSAVSVTNLTAPGVEPHDLELSAAQVAEISSADLVLYVKGFQPAVDDAVAQQAANRSIDVTADIAMLTGDEGADPHVWLDPANMSAIGKTIAARLTSIDPAATSTFTSGSAALTTAMTALTRDYKTALGKCASDKLVVSHDAFGYLAKAFGFTQIGISGLNPEAEPSPARMREVAAAVRDNKVTTIYYETLVDPKVAETIAAETGAKAAMLDPLEGLVAGATGDYVSVMKENLATLKVGQQCS